MTKIAIIVNNDTQADTQRHHADNVDNSLKVLESQGYETYVLSPSRPSQQCDHYYENTDAFKNALSGLSGENAELVYYVTGHGSVVANNRSEKASRLDSDDLCVDGNECNLPSDVLFSLTGFSSRTVIVDQCTSGTIATTLLEGGKTLFISAGTIGESVNCTQFIPYFWGEVPDSNNDGNVSWAERYDFAVRDHDIDSTTQYLFDADYAVPPKFPSEVVHVSTEAALNQQLKALDPSDRAVVYFSASWCEPCKKFSPVYEKFPEQFGGKVLFIKFDNDTPPASWHVEYFPTVFLVNSKGIRQEVSSAEIYRLDQRLLKEFEPNEVRAKRLWAKALNSNTDMVAAYRAIDDLANMIKIYPDLVKSLVPSIFRCNSQMGNIYEKMEANSEDKDVLYFQGNWQVLLTATFTFLDAKNKKRYLEYAKYNIEFGTDDSFIAADLFLRGYAANAGQENKKKLSAFVYRALLRESTQISSPYASNLRDLFLNYYYPDPDFVEKQTTRLSKKLWAEVNNPKRVSDTFLIDFNTYQLFTVDPDENVRNHIRGDIAEMLLAILSNPDRFANNAVYASASIIIGDYIKYIPDDKKPQAKEFIASILRDSSPQDAFKLVTAYAVLTAESLPQAPIQDDWNIIFDETNLDECMKDYAWLDSVGKLGSNISLTYFQSLVSGAENALSSLSSHDTETIMAIYVLMTKLMERAPALSYLMASSQQLMIGICRFDLDDSNYITIKKFVDTLTQDPVASQLMLSTSVSAGSQTRLAFSDLLNRFMVEQENEKLRLLIDAIVNLNINMAAIIVSIENIDYSSDGAYFEAELIIELFFSDAFILFYKEEELSALLECVKKLKERGLEMNRIVPALQRAMAFITDISRTETKVKRVQQIQNTIDSLKEQISVP